MRKNEPGKSGSAGGASPNHESEIWINFSREPAPLLIVTALFGHPNRFEISWINSAFALPSTGGDLSEAFHVPSSSCSSALVRAFGLTLTWIVFIEDEKSGTSRLRFSKFSEC